MISCFICTTGLIVNIWKRIKLRHAQGFTEWRRGAPIAAVPLKNVRTGSPYSGIKEIRRFCPIVLHKRRLISPEVINNNIILSIVKLTSYLLIRLDVTWYSGHFLATQQPHVFCNSYLSDFSYMIISTTSAGNQCAAAPLDHGQFPCHFKERQWHFQHWRRILSIWTGPDPTLQCKRTALVFEPDRMSFSFSAAPLYPHLSPAALEILWSV